MADSAATKPRRGDAQLGGRVAWFGLALVLVFLAAWNIWATLATEDAADQVRSASLISDSFQQARYAAGAEESLERKYRLNPGPDIRAMHAAAAYDLINALHEAIRVERAGDPALPETTAEVERALELHAEYIDWIARMFQAVDAGSMAAANQIDSSEIDPLFGQIETIVNTEAQDHRGYALAALADLGATQRLVRAGTVVVFSVGFLLLAVFWFVLRAYHRRESRSEERFRALVQNASDGVAILDPQGTISYASPAMGRLVGRDSAALLGLDAFGLAHPERAAAARAQFDAALARPGVNVEAVLRLHHADGSWRDVAVVATNLVEQPAIGGVVVTYRDITDQVESEEERARLISAVEQTADSIMIQHLDGTIAYVNPSFSRLYGYSLEQVIGRSARLLDSGHHSEDFWTKLWDSVVGGETWTGLIVNRRQDGSSIEVESVISALRDGDGRVTSFIQADRDVTRERALEAQLRQSQKMEAIGQLAGGIAHDFNNLLTAIRGYTELARGQLAATDQARSDLDEVIANADRAVELTRGLLAFSRRQVLQPQIADPAAIIEGIVPLLRRLIGEHIDLDTRTKTGAGRVRVDASQLEQVIVNLALNARDAMPSGGRLAIETAAVYLDAEYVGTHPGVTVGPHILLAVSDTGMGMDPETQAHLFEPFFTTKEPGKGTGLGLATVYGIVKQSGGSIYVYSEPDHGTTFKIYLPQADALVNWDATEQTLGAIGGDETILLVEDDDAVRAFASRVLSAMGYRLVEAPDTTAAMLLAAAHRGTIDLLLTDVVMPGLSGPEFAQRLSEDQPDLRILYISGYVQDHFRGSEVLAPDAKLLSKPFTAAALARAVREALSSKS